MRRSMIVSLSCAIGGFLMCAAPAAAQVIGTFSWQLQPFCNTLTLTVTQVGGIYRLDGFDGQCSAGTRAAASGIAVPNPNGTIGLGLTIVSTPGAAPVHVDAAITIATLGGAWKDSIGNSGSFVFGGVGDGPPVLPMGTLLVSKFNNGAVLAIRRFEGTPAAPARVGTNDLLGSVEFQGYDGGAVSPGAHIRTTATQAWTPNAHGARLVFWTTSNNVLGPSPRMTIDQDGRVGIGVQDPADQLDVAGDIRIGTGTSGCVRDRDGTQLTGGACSSDARFKRNIIPFEPVLGKIASLRPVHYFWRADEFPARAFGRRQSYGLVAQDVEEVLPELVTTDDEGYKAVNYSKLPLLAIQAIKELKTENDTLKIQLGDVLQRLSALEARVKDY